MYIDSDNAKCSVQASKVTGIYGSTEMNIEETIINCKGEDNGVNVLNNKAIQCNAVHCET